MKKAIKLIVSMALGACLGFMTVWIGVFLFTDTSFSTLEDKFVNVELGELAGIFLMASIFMFFSFFLQVIIHEGGHLVCGLATGYRFVSFRILNFTLIRQDGKFCIKRFGIAGTGGQCLLTPPDKPLQDIPCVLYNLGGIIANLLTAVIAIFLLLTIDGMPYPLKLFLFLFCFTGIFLGLTSGIPMKIGGIGNDADNMRLLLKDQRSKQALVTQLHVNALVQKGMRPKDMPEEWFHQEGVINYKDALQTSVHLMFISRLADLGEWDRAYHALEETLKHKDEIIGLFIKEITCELLYIALISGKSDQVEELYTDEIALYIKQYRKVMSSKQRLLCALALYRDKDAAKAKEIYETVCHQKDKYLMQGEVIMDIDFMKSILNAENVL